MSDDEDNDNNILRFGAIAGGKVVSEDDNTIPENDYVVTDLDDDEFFTNGFLIFTPHHLAIMRDKGKGAVPVLVMPIARVKAAELLEENIEGES